MSTNPLVSVVMPAFNAEKYLCQAIESILSQTVSDLEFIIIDDGSTDNTASILAEYKGRDARIQVHRQINSGVAVSMNYGCALAKGKYIARMDADDISLPQRLERQLAYLDNNPGIGVCGTWMRTFGDLPHSLSRYPDDANTAQSTLPFRLSVTGPSIVFKRTLYTEQHVRYRTHVGAADDYLFIVECSKYCGISSVPEVLYQYRKHSTQITNTQRTDQHKFARQIRLQQLGELGLQPSDHEVNVHEAICTWQMKGDQSWVKTIEGWLMKLKAANQENLRYPEAAFSSVVTSYWFAACCSNADLGLWTFKRFHNSPLVRDESQSLEQRLRLLAKCLIKHV